MEDKPFLEAAIAVAVALIGTAIYLRRRYGAIGEIWTAALAHRLRLDRAMLFKAALGATVLLWVGAWLLTTPEQRADWKETFYENSPFAPMMKPLDGWKD